MLTAEVPELRAHHAGAITDVRLVPRGAATTHFQQTASRSVKFVTYNKQTKLSPHHFVHALAL